MNRTDRIEAAKAERVATDGGPAFPVVADNGLGHVSAGMSLRDYFAGQSVIGILSVRETNDVDLLAKAAYQLADAMLVARAGKQPPDQTGDRS